MSYAFYMEYYGYTGMDDYTKDQIYRGVPVYSPVFSSNKWSPKNGEKLDFEKLEFGDLVLYDFSDRTTEKERDIQDMSEYLLGLMKKGCLK